VHVTACFLVEVDVRYEFIIKGSVGESVVAVLPQMRTSSYPTGGTSLFGPVRDEADVLAVLQSIATLGLTVVEFRRLPD
jgi:hypothetical protein